METGMAIFATIIGVILLIALTAVLQTRRPKGNFGLVEVQHQKTVPPHQDTSYSAINDFDIRQ